jgi:dTDP-4-amino-4,6-dideoxygalactose transaminase
VKNIPPVDLSKQYKLISTETNAAILEILASGRYIGGPTVIEFENNFAQYTGVEHCVACNSGTDALFLALKALNIGPGDEVITTTFTFIATSEVIIRVGAKPVFIDIDLDTFNLDLSQLEKAITPQTKAIIPVHLFGQPLNMSILDEIASKYHLFIIEDCAQATGASWNQQKVGSIGHIGCFSFFPTKNLGACGDGGAITTNDGAIASHIKMLREHGSSVRYRHDQTGINSRLDAIQAAILNIKLRYLDQWNKQREKVAQNYQELLKNIPGIKLPQAISGGNHVWNQYTILVEKNRDQVKEKLQENGIISMIYYPIPLHLQPVYNNLGYQKGDLLNAEKACDQVLSLPMFSDLTYEEQQEIAYSLKEL